MTVKFKLTQESLYILTINMMFNSLRDYQVKINEKFKVMLIFLTSIFIITCILSINTFDFIQLVSGSGDNSTFKLDQKTSEASQNDTIEDYSNSLPDLFDKVEKSVVQITEPGSIQATERDPSRLGS